MMKRNLLLISAALIFAAATSSVFGATRQAELCADGTYHQALFCPPLISSLTVPAVGQTSGTASYSLAADTVALGGVSYCCTNGSASSLTAAQIVLCSGGLADTADSPTTEGVRTVALDGLTSNTSYYTHCVTRSAEGHYSNTLSSSSFETTGGANSLPVASNCDQDWDYSSAEALDLDACYTDGDLDSLTYSLVSGSLPTNTTQSGARNKDIARPVGVYSLESQTVIFGATDGNDELVTDSLTTSASFQSIPFSQQSGVFTFTFDVTPVANDTLDTVISFSVGDPVDWDDLDVTVRLYTSGLFDACNGCTSATYDAVNSIAYATPNTYTVTGTIDVPNQQFSASVGGTVLATDYAFRDGSTATLLNTFSVLDAGTTGSTVANVQITNVVIENEVDFAVFEADLVAPDAPSAPTEAATSATTITIGLPTSAATDHASYEVHRSTDDVSYSQVTTGVTASSWQDAGLTAETTYYYKLKDVDQSGNVSALGAALTTATIAAVVGDRGWDAMASCTAPRPVYTGSHTITGTQSLSNYTFTSQINVEPGAHLTLNCVEVTAGTQYGIWIKSSTTNSLTMSDSWVHGASGKCIYAQGNYFITNSRLSNCTDTFYTNGQGNGILQNSDLGPMETSEANPHSDPVQIYGGGPHVIQNNEMDCRRASVNTANSCVAAQVGTQGSPSNITVHNNHFTGYPGYAIRVQQKSGYSTCPAPYYGTDNEFDDTPLFGHVVITSVCNPCTLTGALAGAWNGNIDENGNALKAGGLECF